LSNVTQAFDIASFFHFVYTSANHNLVGWSGYMNICANRFRKAIRLASVLALSAALATPSIALSAAEKKPVKKAPTSQSTAKRAPTGQKAAATKAPSTTRITQSKAVQKKVARTEPKQARAAAPKARNQATSKASGPQQVRAKQSPKNTVLARNSKPSTAGKVAQRGNPSASLVRVAAVPRLSAGERLGLRGSDDALDLNSSVALVIDQDTNEVLFSKNDSAVLPIASLTKLMTGLVIADANLSMDEAITITQDDVDTFKGSSSRLAVGSTLTRGEMMHLALMSSENRAAHALGRTFPGGMRHFVGLMNSKARELGMHDTRYVEPTGLLSQNQSSARDLATLVSVAYERPILRDLSTSPGHQLALGHRTLQYNNSNRLVRSSNWDIGLQKTGYISEAGRCLVMQARVAGRKVIMVFLDSAGVVNRVQDAERVRRWVEAQTIQATFVRPQG